MTNKTPPKTWWIPRLDDVVFFAVFLGAAGQGNRMLNIDGDLGRHLTLGGYILDTLRIPTTDLFSHTLEGSRLIPHEWLSEVIFAASYRILGLSGVVIVSSLILAATFYILYLQARKYSGLPLISAGLVIIGIGATSFHWLTRPHLFSYLFIVVWIYILDLIRNNKKQVWIYLPVLMLFWANLHGGFVVGFAIWGIYLFGQLMVNLYFNKQPAPPGSNIREFAAGGIASLIASLVNPAGWEIWKTSLGYLQNRYLTSHTWEYQPPDLSEPTFWPFVILILISLWSILLLKKRAGIMDSLLVIGIGIASFTSARVVPFFSLLSIPITAGWLRRLYPQAEQTFGFGKMEARIKRIEGRFGGLIWPFEIAIGGFIWAAVFPFVNHQAIPYSFSSKVFPVEAQKWIAEYKPDGNMFNYFNWGGYLLLENWPERQVFIDAQTDFYGEDFTRKYSDVLSARPGWQEVLNNYRVEWVIIPPGEPLARSLEESSSWKRQYLDETAGIWSYDP